jgi:hypothetical protein
MTNKSDGGHINLCGKLDTVKSNHFLLCQGVTQTRALLPTICLFLINGLVAQLASDTKTAMYADDLVMWCNNKSNMGLTSLRSVDTRNTCTFLPVQFVFFLLFFCLFCFLLQNIYLNDSFVNERLLQYILQSV